MKNGLYADNCTRGSFDRRNFAGSLVQKKLNKHSVWISKAKSFCVYQDFFARRLAENGVLDAHAVKAYEDRMSALLFEGNILEENTDEDVLRLIYREREKEFGFEALSGEKNGALFGEKNGAASGKFENGTGEGPEIVSETITGIDDSDALDVLKKRPGVVFCNTDRKFRTLFSEAVGEALRDGKQVVVLTPEKDYWLPNAEEICRESGVFPFANEKPSVSADSDLLPQEHGRLTVIRISDTFGCMDFSQVDTDAIPGFSDDAFYLRGFGSDALMQARNLRIPAVVNLLPDGHPERAVTNLFTKELHSLVYVPDRFDIVPFVPFTAPTEITYYHLSYLRKKFGESVYRTPIDTLRKTEPGLFFGIYDDHLPVEVDETFTYTGTNFEEAKRKEVTRRAEKSGKVRLIHEVFEDPLVVDGVIASKDAEVRIVTGFEKPVSPRAYFFDRTDDSERIVTNFSFFFTERLRYIYNNLRENRPQEQLSGLTGHVDYCRFYDENGVKHETLPLYNKSCIAYSPESGYHAFRLSLTGGSITFPGLPAISFTESDVNAADTREVIVFTPMHNPGDENADHYSFTDEMPENRLNVAIIGETVVAAREGSVLLPSIGAVLSLSGTWADTLKGHLGKTDKNGYFDVSLCKKLQISVNPPAGMDEEAFRSLTWVYGGGLGLIYGDDVMSAENYLEMIREEGWRTLLSRQTQESAIEKLDRHPRTVVGVTKNHSFFVLVFSGRSKTSVGANYLRLSEVAKQLIPDIDFLINEDGGGSSLLAYLRGHKLTEISLPAPSEGSLTGQARSFSSMIEIIL